MILKVALKSLMANKLRSILAMLGIIIGVGAVVAVLGPVTVENLFGAGDAVGQTVKINGINFRVTGVLKSKGDQGFFNPDDQILIPYTTAMKQLFGVDYVKEIDIQAQDNADLTALQNDVSQLIRKRHKIQAGMPEDINIRNQADILETANEFSQRFT